MALPLEDYAMIGDCHTVALVGRDGSIDWLCLPRFDSGACFAALLGRPEHGRWLIATRSTPRAQHRRYRENTLILETEFQTPDGTVCLIDCMAPRAEKPQLIRLVEGRSGRVAMHMELIIRFDYGSIVPWVRKIGNGLGAIAGPDRLELHTPVPLRGVEFTTVADWEVAAGERVPFVLLWHESHLPSPCPLAAEEGLAQTESWWREWASQCTYDGEWKEAVMRALLTLEALIYAPTGGIVAAPTTSLPEQLGGVRNWDYRFCWLRDATFTLFALMNAGFDKEAVAWREWLLRALAGKPSETQILYGLAGERRLTEFEIPWLPGYADSRPVRIGNAAARQFQLDVYGELIDAMYQCRACGLPPEEPAWRLELALLNFLESAWQQPDEGIWEVRGPRRHFTHSKVMAWVAIDRAVRAIEKFHMEGPVDRWRKLRDAIHAQVCDQGFNRDLGSFVQSYGSRALDASLLMIPLVGFLPPTDPRVRGTVAAIERDLLRDGFVARYLSESGVDGLPPGEGAFLPCTFWLADNWILQGRQPEARALFERLLALRNDVGLLSEEFDPSTGRLLGNFPQAFTLVGLVNTAHNLSTPKAPAEQRPRL